MDDLAPLNSEQTCFNPVDVETGKRALDAQGYVLLDRVMTPSMLDRVRSRLVEQAAKERAEGWASSYDADSQGVINLLNKGEVFAELAECPPVLALLEHMLGPDMLLSSLTSHIVGPGTKPQGLHADQRLMPAPWAYPAVANVAWILDDFTADNGATQIAPCSHVHGTHPDPNDPPRTIPAVAPAGSAMVFDGRLWHGAGENRTAKRRHAIFGYYCAPFIRQQENMFLGLDRAVVERASPRLKTLLGYTPYFGKIGIIPRDGERVKVGQIAHRTI
jgi:ectoine hydroxylase-related dioxygenase (phytanoyl-CoA dioxygenase family)